jgi:hypothetical protein
MKGSWIIARYIDDKLYYLKFNGLGYEWKPNSVHSTFFSSLDTAGNFRDSMSEENIFIIKKDF